MLSRANTPNWALLGVLALLLSITHALSSAVPTQHIQASVNDFIEGNSSSQNLASNITLSCNQRTAVAASVHLEDRHCRNLCQITERLPGCALDMPNSVVRLMDLAKQQNAWVNKESPPSDASCRDTAVQLTQGPYGVGAYAAFSSNPLPDLSTLNFTISSRFKLLSGGSQKDILLSVTSGTKKRYLVLYFRNVYQDKVHKRFVLYTYGKSKQKTYLDNVPVFDGKYHNFVLQVFHTGGKSQMRVYVDNKLIGSSTLQSPMSWDQNAQLHIGKRTYTSTAYKYFNFNGVIDDIIVHPTIWSEEHMTCMSGDNCGEMLEKPADTKQIQVTYADGGRTLHFGPIVKSVADYEHVLQSVRYRYTSSITRNLTGTVKIYVACTTNSNKRQSVLVGSTQSFHIVDTNTNVPPSVFLGENSANTTYIYDQASIQPHLIAKDLLVQDSDSTKLQSAVVSLSQNSPGFLSIDSDTATGIIPTVSGSSRQITLHATVMASGASLSSFQAILRTIQYTVSSTTNPPDSPILVTFEVTDVTDKPGAARASSKGFVTIGIQRSGNRVAPTIAGLHNINLPYARIASLARDAEVSDGDDDKNVTKITVQLTDRPTPRASPVTGQTCERYTSLIERTNQCRSKSSTEVFDLICLATQYAEVNSPIYLNNNGHLGDGCSAGFDGTSSMNFNLKVPKSAKDFTGQDVSSFAVSAWFNVDNRFGCLLAITDPWKGMLHIDRLISICYDTYQNEILLRAGLNTKDVTFNSIGDLTVNNWHHIVVTVSNSIATLYLNGTFRGSKQVQTVNGKTASYIVPNGYHFYLGARPYREVDDTNFKMGGNLTGLHLWFNSEPGNIATCIKNKCPNSLEVTKIDGISVTYDDATPRLELTGSGHVQMSDFQNVLQTLKYNGQGSMPGQRRFTYNIQDEAYQTTTADQLLLDNE